jgi:polyisoprenoid-binding protein YceI
VIAQEVYVLDARHTTPTFEVTHIGFSQQRGIFGNTTGKVTLDRTAKKGTIDVSIASASVLMAPAVQTVAKGEELP